MESTEIVEQLSVSVFFFDCNCYVVSIILRDDEE